MIPVWKVLRTNNKSPLQPFFWERGWNECNKRPYFLGTGFNKQPMKKADQGSLVTRGFHFLLTQKDALEYAFDLTTWPSLSCYTHKVVKMYVRKEDIIAKGTARRFIYNKDDPTLLMAAPRVPALVATQAYWEGT